MTGRHLPAPFRTLDYEMIGLLQLHPTGPPTIVEVDRLKSELIVDDAPRVRLAITPGDLYQYGDVTGYAIGDRNIVELDYTERGGNHVWRWDLGQPCTGP
jgi:hypothetical protein